MIGYQRQLQSNMGNFLLEPYIISIRMMKLSGIVQILVYYLKDGLLVGQQLKTKYIMHLLIISLNGPFQMGMKQVKGLVLLLHNYRHLLQQLQNLFIYQKGGLNAFHKQQERAYIINMELIKHRGI